MGRQFTAHDPDWGAIDLYVITEYEDGRWEGEWEPFRIMPELAPISQLFSRVSYEAYQDALRKYPMPLIKELGLPPEICLVKLGIGGSTMVGGTRLDEGDPGLFEVETFALKAYELWRMGVYIVIAPAGGGYG